MPTNPIEQLAPGRPLKAVSFDLWLTLLKSNPEARRGRVAAIAAAFGTQPSEALNTLSHEVSSELDRASSETGTDYGCGDRLDRIADRLRKPRLDGDARRAAIAAVQLALLAAPPRLIEADVAQTLATLRTGYRLMCISNTGYASGATMRQNLEKIGVAQHFDAMVFSDEVGVAKPDPKIFEVAAARLGLQPSEILHIGDSQVSDIGGGKAAGYRVAWFSPGAANSESTLGSVSALTI
jgi:putative hydrolase of the HAD superfamily